MGQSANVILFMATLVGLAIFGAYVLAHTARCFLLIVEQTTEGMDKIDWPRDPWTEWILRAAHLAGVVALWLVPVGLALRVLGRTAPHAALVLWVALPTLFFWLLFPFNLLSAFSAVSPWMLFRWEVLRRMARRPAATALFYLLSAPVCLAAAGILCVGLAGGFGWILALLATVVFLYARLLGRLGSILARVKLKTRRPPPEEEPRDPILPTAAERDTARPRKRRKRSPEDEEDSPPPESVLEESPHPDMVEGYGLKDEEPRPRPSRPTPPAKPRRLRRAYEVRAEPLAEAPEAPPEPEPPEASREPAAWERPLPAHPWLEGIWTFPWYPSNLGTWGLLTLLYLGWGLIYALAHGLLTF